MGDKDTSTGKSRSALGFVCLQGCAAALLLASQAAPAATLLSEDFEDGGLDARISITSVGAFNTAAGIKDITAFGSTKAFGYGLSACGANCFGGFVTTLKIDFGSPTFVGSLSFKEMELFDNWGSGGGVFLDGAPLATSIYDFGRLPYNDRQADSTFRQRQFDLNRTVSTIELQVWDITYLSEIAIDDLNVSSVPEPSAWLLFATGLAWVARKARKAG